MPQPLRALFGMHGVTFDIAVRRVISLYPLVIYVPLEFDPQPEKFAAYGVHASEQIYREYGRTVYMVIHFEKQIGA